MDATCPTSEGDRFLTGGKARPAAIGALYLLGVANGLAGNIVMTICANGFSSALADTFDVSLVVIAATSVGMMLIARTPRGRIDTWDRVAGATYLLGLCIPHSAASMAALTFFAAYEGIRQRRSVEAVAAASLFIGIAICQTWGLVLLHLFAGPLLAVDATFVAWLLGTIQGDGVEHIGNLVEVADGQPLVIMIGCSSFSNMSFALLCWMTVVRASRPGWLRSDLGIAFGVVIAVIALNVLRMGLMGLSRDAYLLLHGPVGANVFNTLILVTAISAGWYASAPGKARRPPTV
jgi:hypothetical protein